MPFYGELEGTGFEVLDQRFTACFVGHARVERLWNGARWGEGPVWFAPGRYLVWSDIPNNRMLCWHEPSQQVSVFRQPANNANGNTVDNQGRLITCEHLSRRVTRTELDGSITVLADQWKGKKLNAPNDVVVKSDDSIWFTDPGYGIMHDYEGEYGEPEYEGCHVFRIDPRSGTVEAMITDCQRPNGLAFSPDEQYLYVADTGATHAPDGARHIRRFKLNDDGIITDSIIFAECGYGLFDGFRVDRSGRLWSSAEDGVHIFDPDSTLIGKIHIPEIVSNVTFGGARRNRLFICATTSLYSVYVTANGCKLG